MFGFQQPQRNTGEFFKQIFLGKNVLSRLILINTSVFILVTLANTIAWLFKVEQPNEMLSVIGQFLALPSSISALATKPWTIFTYMFLHEGFLHLLFNLIMLYFGGIIFLEYLSEKKLMWTYLLGGLAGALFFVAAFNIFPVFAEVKGISIALGASASVLAIIIAIATYVPDYSVMLFLFGRVKLKYLALVFIAIDLMSLTSGNAGGHIAHLGGALLGFIYGYSLRTGNDFMGFLNRLKFPDFFSNRRTAKFDTSRPESGRPMDDDVYNKKRVAKQEEIDRILEKIKKSGYESLTKAEKDLLFDSSKN
jgi:membrane associated rhomboid family serine protease